MFKEVRLLILTGIVFHAAVSFALEKVIFGPEFTFTNFEAGISAAPKVIERMHNHLVLGQPEGAKFIRSDGKSGGEFLSPNEWSFHHHIEEEVIEVRMAPQTAEFYRHFASDMQDAIFVSAANEGFFPAMFRGGGHINVSSRSFLEDPLLFRNFIVDILNHNELFMGVFGYDTNNALPLPLASERVIAAVKGAILDFDSGRYKSEMDMVQFAKHLGVALSSGSDSFWGLWNNKQTNRLPKFNALSFFHFGGDEADRLELRGVRPQASVDVWVRQIDLIYHRLLYLEKIRQPIPLKWKVPLGPVASTEAVLLNPPIDPQLALRAFYEYVTESGVSWSQHRDYLWPKWMTDGELEKFENSSWFKEREKAAAQNCGEWLKAA